MRSITAVLAATFVIPSCIQPVQAQTAPCIYSMAESLKIASQLSQQQ